MSVSRFCSKKRLIDPTRYFSVSFCSLIVMASPWYGVAVQSPGCRDGGMESSRNDPVSR